MQIGDENVHRVRAVMDEVFGEENFVSQIAFRKTRAQSGELCSQASRLHPLVCKKKASKSSIDNSIVTKSVRTADSSYSIG